jgi:hypothetical protein
MHHLSNRLKMELLSKTISNMGLNMGLLSKTISSQAFAKIWIANILGGN